MGLFDRLRNQDKPDPGTLPEEERPYSHRASPQGWTDRVSEWPDDKLARFEVLFPYPSDAVASLAEQLGRGFGGLPQAERRARMEAAFLALQALRLERRRIPDYKGTYGAFLAWVKQRPALEELLGFKLAGSVAQNIGEELRGCEDPELSALGSEFLERVLRVTAPDQSLDEFDRKRRKAREVQEMMFARVESHAARDTPPAQSFQLSGFSGPTRPHELVDPDEVIDLDEPVDRVPEPEEPGPGERAAAAQRAVLARMATSPGEADLAAVGVAEADAFPCVAGGEKGARTMTAQVVFRTLLEECLKDGKLTPMEMRTLSNLRKQLGLDLVGHEQMLRQVQAQLAADPPEDTDDLDPLVLFERICWQAVDDDRVDPEEQKILGIVARYLHITPEEYGEIKQRIRARKR